MTPRPRAAGPTPARAAADEDRRRQLPLDLPHRPAMGAQDLLVAAPNAEAVAWLDRWPDWGAPALVLWGPPGCGKSHLVQMWRARSGAARVPAADLATADIGALATPGAAVAIDDAARLAGDPAAERALLHLFNALAEAGGTLLLTARAAPARWGLGLPDLDSRLRAAPAVAIGDPDDALLSAVLVKQMSDRQLEVGAEVVAYLVPRMERSFAAARRLVARIDRLSLAERRPVTRVLAGRALDGEAAAGEADSAAGGADAAPPSDTDPKTERT
jgi:DnaA regulatory inactivator Hda